jgi:putative MATE family efflux protein
LARRSEYATRDLTQGSIPRNLMFLGWPQMVSGLVNALDQLADLFWAGFLGPRAVASTGVAQTWVQFFNTARMGLDTSARAMVSRAVGSGDMVQANHVARQALFFNMTVSLIVSTTAIILSEWLLHVLGVSDAIVEEGATYQRLRFVGSFFFMMNQLGGTLLQAGGDSLTPMRAQLLIRGSHLALSPILMFGWLGLPAWGISGAAAANTISQILGVSLNFRALFTGTSRVHITLKDPSWDWAVVRRQIEIGTPAAITGAERSFAQVILVGLAAPFGATGLAVYSIAQRIQMFGGFGSQGLSMAGGVIVGQSLGAGQPARARQTVWWALAFVAAVQGVICGTIFLFPERVMFLFSRDPEVIAMGAPWLRIEAFGYMLFALGNCLGQCLNTAGDTFVPMLASLGSLWGIQQPVAIVLTGSAKTWEVAGYALAVPTLLDVGPYGIPMAILVASAVRTSALFLYVLYGPWWKKEVLVRGRRGLASAGH